MKQIDSRNNSEFKELLNLKKSCVKDRDAEIFIEGLRLCTDALLSNVRFDKVLVSKSYYAENDMALFADAGEIILLDDMLFRKLCSTQNPQGIAAIVRSPVVYDMEDLSVSPKDRFLICESIQDPGNFGSMIRTADAFGFTGIFFTNDTVDPFNEKVLRSSMGSIFHIRIIYNKSVADLFKWLKENNVTTYAAHLKGVNLPKNPNFKIPCAIVMGNEGGGIREETASLCDHLIRINMTGKADSLNVSNATAILCYLTSIQETA